MPEDTPRVAGGSKCVIPPVFTPTSLAIKSWLPTTSEFGVARAEERTKSGPIASGVVDLPLRFFSRAQSEAHGKSEKSIASEVLTQTELCRAARSRWNEELRSSRPANMVKTLRCVASVTLPGAVWRRPTGLPHRVQRRRSFGSLRGGLHRRSTFGGSWRRRRRDDHLDHDQRRRSARHASDRQRAPLCSCLHLILSLSCSPVRV